jgi:UDP-N-acetylglucosamine 2-epimerase (non-hydrolysing)
VDAADALRPILSAFGHIQRELPLFFVIHPRTRKRLVEFGLENEVAAMAGLRLVEPLGYLDMLRLQEQARLVLTDSGGMQEESTVLGVPCLTIRENTERPITITEGTNVLVGCQPERIVAAAMEVLHGDRAGGRCPELWDGGAAVRLLEVLRSDLQPR